MVLILSHSKRKSGSMSSNFITRKSWEGIQNITMLKGQEKTENLTVRYLMCSQVFLCLLLCDFWKMNDTDYCKMQLLNGNIFI